MTLARVMAAGGNRVATPLAPSEAAAAPQGVVPPPPSPPPADEPPALAPEGPATPGPADDAPQASRPEDRSEAATELCPQCAKPKPNTASEKAEPNACQCSRCGICLNIPPAEDREHLPCSHVPWPEDAAGSSTMQ